MIQVHAAPAHARRRIGIAKLDGGAEGIVGGAEIAYAPETFGCDRRIGGAREPLVAVAGGRVALVSQGFALQRFFGCGGSLRQ